MGAIADLDQLINTLTGGAGAKQQIWWNQDNRIGNAAGAATVAGQFTSLFTFNMTPRGQGAAPGGTARNPTNATNGTLGQSNASGGRQKYLVGAGCQLNVAGTVTIYDRLADISGLSATVTTAQNTTSLAANRWNGSDSVGNQIWIEIFTIIGATATTLTVNYTNQDGTSGRTSQAVAFGGTGRREATRLISVPLQSGDTGVRSVESVTVTATTGTAGDFGVVIARPLISFPIGLAGAGCNVDCLTQFPSMPEIKDNAALSLMMYATTTTSPSSFGFLSMVEA